VLDYFDAVKIGLTATPALHTTQIFGCAYLYLQLSRGPSLTAISSITSRRLADQYRALPTSGIVWKVGERGGGVPTRTAASLDLFTTPDEIKLDVEDFNRKVITESFNRVVCEFLAQGPRTPRQRQKTLIFCVNDAHADLVVHLLKQAFEQHYGSIDDDAVIKITGAARQTAATDPSLQERA